MDRPSALDTLTLMDAGHRRSARCVMPRQTYLRPTVAAVPSGYLTVSSQAWERLCTANPCNAATA
jgi:hypothetical protein